MENKRRTHCASDNRKPTREFAVVWDDYIVVLSAWAQNEALLWNCKLDRRHFFNIETYTEITLSISEFTKSLYD